MKRFLTTVTAYLLIVSAITGAINAAYIARRGEPENEKFGSMPGTIQICNFGSSHGLCSFNYEDVRGRSCFNFGLSSQTLSYDLRLMKCYGDRLEQGGTAYIVVSYFSLFGKPETETDSFESRNRRYYDFLPKEYIKEYDAKTRIYEKYLPALVNGGSVISTLLKGGQNTDDNWSLTADPERVGSDAVRAYKRHILASSVDDGENRIVNPEEISALYEMIELCRSKDVEPILVTTPFLAEYTDAISENDPRFYDDFYSLIDQIVRDTDVRYFDYSSDERFKHDYSLFMNVDHLNRRGARQFTDILIQETIGEP